MPRREGAPLTLHIFPDFSACEFVVEFREVAVPQIVGSSNDLR